MVSREKTSGSSIGRVVRDGKPHKPIFQSFMPDTSKDEQIRGLWRALNDYRKKIDGFPDEINTALDDGLPRLAKNLCLSFGLHLSIAGALASCLSSERMQVDPHLALDFKGAINTVMDLFEERYSPGDFVFPKYAEIAYCVNALCSKCNARLLTEDAHEAFCERKTEVEKYAGLRLD